MREVELEIPLAADASLVADLSLRDGARGVVVFAHGSGSSRRSPRNRRVAAALSERGFATLLLDLLTASEEVVDQRTREVRFDVPLLAGRLERAVAMSRDHAATADLPIGLFGASTGAAAALVAAARRPEWVDAIVSRGGRPDLAGPALSDVQAPTRLIVGGADDVVLGLNRRAAARLHAPHDLQVVPGATHLFEEPGALGVVARLAGDWFTTYLHPVASSRPAEDA